MTSNHAAQAVTPELRLWILEQTRAGHAPQAVLQSMRAAGWDEATAREALAAVTGAQLASPTPRVESPVAPSAAAALPEPDLATSPLYLDAGDRRVHVLQAMMNPRVVVFGDLLSDEECEQMIALARPRLARSLTVATRTGGEEINAKLLGAGAPACTSARLACIAVT